MLDFNIMSKAIDNNDVKILKRFLYKASERVNDLNSQSDILALMISKNILIFEDRVNAYTALMYKYIETENLEKAASIVNEMHSLRSSIFSNSVNHRSSLRKNSIHIWSSISFSILQYNIFSGDFAGFKMVLKEILDAYEEYDNLMPPFYYTSYFYIRCFLISMFVDAGCEHIDGKFKFGEFNFEMIHSAIKCFKLSASLGVENYSFSPFKEFSQSCQTLSHCFSFCFKHKASRLYSFEEISFLVDFFHVRPSCHKKRIAIIFLKSIKG